MAELTAQRIQDLEFYNFDPRPDQPLKGDQQTSFLRSQHSGVTFLLGGNGCLAAEQEVFDPVDHVFRRVSEIDHDFHVWSKDAYGNRVISEAKRPTVCGIDDIYEVSLSNGISFRVTSAHRILDNLGQWREIRELAQSQVPLESGFDVYFDPVLHRNTAVPGQFLARSFRTGSRWQRLTGSDRNTAISTRPKATTNSEFPFSVDCPSSCFDDSCGLSLSPKYAPRLSRKALSCLDCYRKHGRFYDARLPRESDNARFSFPLRVGALERNRFWKQMDGMENGQVRIHPYREFGLQSNNGFDQAALRFHGEQCVSSEPCLRFFDQGDILFQSFRSNIFASRLTTGFQKFPEEICPDDTLRSSREEATAFLMGDPLEAESSRFALSRQQISMRQSQSLCEGGIPNRNGESNTPENHLLKEFERSESSFSQIDTIQSSDQSAIPASVSACVSFLNGGLPPVRIISVRYLRRDVFWDFHVPVHNNYWMDGIWHHNSGTTTTALAKMVEFICFEQEPPRKDTPFWILAKNYEQVMNTCWKEKLHQKGHLNPNDVDWERISWYRPNQDWPYRVPLKPRPGRPGKNWQLCFKSYEQGRGAMMGESIGGFLFVEQFPWGILEEVLRGCREYAFTGNKLAEFTPVEPSMCMELRDMEENNRLPAGWAIYRANTECAMEAGHVQKQWYDDYFGMMTPEVRMVRQKGLWGAFEGAVYPEWNPIIHCLPETYKIPSGWHHRRAIDFGYSKDHAFACLWGAHNGRGQWVIYDEYYSTDTSKGVIEHWKEIADKHYWPENSPYYGLTYVDHDLDAIRTLSRIHEYTDGEYSPPSMSLAKKAVHEGIEHMHTMLKPNLFIDPNNPVPRLQVVRTCKNLMREMINYRWPKRLSTSVNAAAPKPEPIKDDDHAVDCLRYLIFSEASGRDVAPKAIAKQHSPGSVQIQSDKFKKYARGAKRR